MTEQINADYKFNRSYEVSVWTLQDSFITVLKWSNMEHKGTIQNPHMSLNTDGTQNFSFSIPMSLYINGVWKDNPIWYNTSNGTLLTNMRKIKVIFNKKTEDEEVYEFLITRITMTHSEDRPECEINCENGLAYHELGKQGYKIELSSELFYEEDRNTFDSAEEILELEEQDEEIVDNNTGLHATIDYWCEKMGIPKAETDEDINDPRQWYYRVEMDWGSYSNIDGDERQSDEIYEEEYVASWDEDGHATHVESYKEKERLIDEKNSNLYNLTQNVAKTFNVYCRYKYLYDDNYHIMGRLIIFYNNFFNEQDGVFQFSYPYSTTEVTREIDSTDIVTKMYVDAIYDDSASGVLSIMNTEANKMREDYLLNFDYLYETQTITDEQYEEIKNYEEQMRHYNNLILPLQTELNKLYEEKVDVEAKRAVADNGRALAQERLDDVQALISSLNATDSVADDVISYGADAPDSATVMYDSEEKYYYITLKTKGIVEGSIKVYGSYPITSNSVALKGYKVETDKDGNISKITNINKDSNSPLVYLVYDYSPAEYYKNIINTWTIRQAKDEDSYNSYDAQCSAIETAIEEKTDELETLLEEKAALIKEFELMMGPALREGHWTPEDYSNYGDRYSKSMLFPTYQNAAYALPILGPQSNYIRAAWDNELFTDEQHNYFKLGVNEEITYYPHLVLSDENWAKILPRLQQKDVVSILYYDYAVQDVEQEQNKNSHWRTIAIGSGAQIICIADGRPGKLAVRPAIIVTDAESMSDEEIAYMQGHSTLSIVTSELSEQNEPILNIENLVTLTNNDWLTKSELANNVVQVYPRLIVNTLDLMNNTEDLVIKYNNQRLKDYEEYQVLIRDETYCITLKPLNMLLRGWTTSTTATAALRQQLDIRYAISNASTSIYLDAIQVHKENAYPKVSYSLSPNILNKTLLRKIYTFLNRIININDVELKLHDAFGYVSEIDLDLDHPWNDSITIQNYNNKFEDIFSTITAQTEAMQRREYSLNETMQIVDTASGQINEAMLQETISNAMLNYSFNSNKLNLTEADGLIGESDDGLIAFRNNGIFTSNEKDNQGNYVWKTAILPSGINANVIKAGQLDTDKIVIYSGNDIRFQWNSEGLYAYRSILESVNADMTQEEISSVLSTRTNDVNASQYVVFNSDGLSLVHKNWNTADAAFLALPQDTQDEITANGIKQVEVSWRGLIMRDFTNQKVFYADADTGDLVITGNFSAHGGNIGGWHVGTGKLEAGTPPTHEDENHHTSGYVALDTAGEYRILAGSDVASYAPFSVKNDGTLKAIKGDIGGWKIGSDALISSSETLRLISEGQNAGLLFVASTQSTAERTKLIGNDSEPYILYQYTTDMSDNEATWHDCYHKAISELETAVTITLSTSGNKTGGAKFNEYNFQHEVTVQTSVQPRYKIYKSVIDDSNPDMTSTITTTYVGWVSDEEDTANDSYAAMDAANDPRIVHYSVTQNGVTTSQPLEYDIDEANANAINNTVWFTKLVESYRATATSPITLNLENGTVTVQSTANYATEVNQYVIYNTENQWKKITLDESIANVRLRTTTYTPTFSIGAVKGDLHATYGQIGNFTINDTDLSNGTLTNSYLAPSNYITIRQADGTNKNCTLEEIGQAFFDLKINSKKGIVTMVRLNGDEVNFKTAALKSSQAANAAAGTIKSWEISYPRGAYGAVKITAQTGSGTTKTDYAYLDKILTTASYNEDNFFLYYDSNDGTLHDSSYDYVYLRRRGNGGTYSSIKIRDGGAYKAGQQAAGSSSSGSGTLQLSAHNNSMLNFTVSENKGWFTNTITGKVNKPVLSYSNSIIQYSFAGYTINNLVSIANSSQDDDKIILTTYQNETFEFTHGKYTAGWNAGWNAVTLDNPVWNQNNNNHTATITVSAQNKTDNTPRSQSATLTLSDVSNDNNSVQLTYGNNTLTYTHNKYNSGWYTCYNALDVANHTVTIDGIDYYQCPISDLPTIN